MNGILKQVPNSSENVCLVSGDHSIHHLDHLAVIAYIMDAPIVVDTEQLHKIIRNYYPQVKSLYMQFHQQILEYFGFNHKRIFFSVASYKGDLSPMIEAFFGKKMEFWYCPHGNSDKTLKHYDMQSHALIYGEQMKNRLQRESHMKALKTYVCTGNVRALFYRKFKKFYDQLVEREIFSQFIKKQTTYFYAPTWEDSERSSSFFDISISLINQLPDSINLIVKMHPWLEHHHSGYVNLIREQYQNKPNVVILCDYPLVFPILEKIDLYLGDFSSIGYDFLAYNRPMFFFDPQKRVCTRKNSAHLHTCGTVIPSESCNACFPFMDVHIKEQSHLSYVRQKLYEEAFGQEQTFTSIKAIVENGGNTPFLL